MKNPFEPVIRTQAQALMLLEAARKERKQLTVYTRLDCEANVTFEWLPQPGVLSLIDSEIFNETRHYCFRPEAVDTTHEALMMVREFWLDDIEEMCKSWTDYSWTAYNAESDSDVS